jgi:GGDEF domain-containing protein
MSLSNSLNSMPTTRLMKMNGLPSTEDLRYMLVTAKEQKKMVELPYKHTNGFSFCVKVVPPMNQFGPKWTFGKDDGSPAFWTRESIDVMMIQNKMKIDSISSLNADEMTGGQQTDSQQAIVFRPTATGNNYPAFNDPLQNPFNNPNAVQPPPGFGNMGGPSHGWMPQAKEKEEEKKVDVLPEALPLDPESILITTEHLQNPDTGLTHFSAFTYFLQREFSNFRKNGVKMAVLLFDFRDKDSGDLIELPVEALEIVGRHMHQKCSPFDIASRMPDSGEFVVLLPGHSGSDGMQFASGLWQEMTQEFYTTFGEDPRSVAVGVSSIPEQCADPGVLLATARKAKEQARLTARSHQLYVSF